MSTTGNDTNGRDSASSGSSAINHIRSVEISPGNKAGQFLQDALCDDVKCSALGLTRHPMSSEALEYQQLSYKIQDVGLTNQELEQLLRFETFHEIERCVTQFDEVLSKNPLYDDQDTSDPIAEYEKATQGRRQDAG